MGGNVVGYINIPLQEIPQRLEELKTLNQPLILCCVSEKIEFSFIQEKNREYTYI
jgi:hypothetical protein